MKIDLNITTTSVTASIRVAGAGANSSAVRVSRFFDIAALRWYPNVEVNWSALGGQSIEVATEFSRAMADAVHIATLLQNLHLADYDFNKPEDRESVKTFFTQLEAVLETNRATPLELARDNPKVAARRVLNDLMQLQFCARQLLSDLPSKRDWLDPDLERTLRDLVKGS